MMTCGPLEGAKSLKIVRRYIAVIGEAVAWAPVEEQEQFHAQLFDFVTAFDVLAPETIGVLFAKQPRFATL